MSSQRNLILGGLIGGIAAYTSYLLLIRGFGIIFPFLVLVATIAVGSIFGGFAADTAHKWTGSHLIILGIASFSGLIAPICLLQILFLVYGTD